MFSRRPACVVDCILSGMDGRIMQADRDRTTVRIKKKRRQKAIFILF